MHTGAASDPVQSCDYVLFTDADIAHPPDLLRRLVGQARRRDLDLASVMAQLRAVSPFERLLVPAFVYFFGLLYPFRWSNDPNHKTAAAAGGCVLVRRRLLDRVGGFEPIRGKIIDDCALAAAVKRAGGRTWLGWHAMFGACAATPGSRVSGMSWHGRPTRNSATRPSSRRDGRRTRADIRCASSRGYRRDRGSGGSGRCWTFRGDTGGWPACMGADGLQLPANDALVRRIGAACDHPAIGRGLLRRYDPGLGATPLGRYRWRLEGSNVPSLAKRRGVFRICPAQAFSCDDQRRQTSKARMGGALASTGAARQRTVCGRMSGID